MFKKDLFLMSEAKSALSRWFDKKSGDSLLLRLLLESVPQHKAHYFAAVVAMVFVAGTTAATAWIMGAIIDAMNNPTGRMHLYMVASGVALIFFLKGIASFAQAVLMARAGNRIVARKQAQLYRKLLSQGMGFFSSTESSDVIVRVTQSAQMARSVIDIIVTSYVRDMLTLLGLVGVMVYQQPLLSAVCLLVGPASLFGVQRILRSVRLVMAQEMVGITEIIKVVQETSTGARVVKAFALEEQMAQRMEAAIRQVEKRANKIVRLEAATSPLMDTITGLAVAGIVVLSATTLFGQSVGTPGQLMSFVTAFLMAYEPAKRLSKMRVSIESGMVGVTMMYDLMDQPNVLVQAVDAVDLPDGPGHLRLENLRFYFTPDRPVINGITLDFAAGTTTALVGPSGGGKSTLLNLMLRMYDPNSGNVQIDGINLRQATLASLRRKIAYVGQDTFLFSTSVMENLRMVRPSATDDEVIEAARVAHADEFISSLSQGYHTQIGENGTFLSGGQRQRLAIARAVLRRAPILLLDEATSALDSHSEALVRDALERITKGITTVIVAHRLSTVMRADRICYVDDGKVIEVGSLKELLAANGKFRALYDQQFAGH
ncbi:ABC transporter ATP-binding protein [Cypionkella sp. TWP1-2-1b2]|uniref:ABC transporter ATP-binding protein n=1 Tax=Cypionkella sp. TWP1-2-1b2 TaxID=2804675 RepID=UPI003CE7EBDA